MLLGTSTATHTLTGVDPIAHSQILAIKSPVKINVMNVLISDYEQNIRVLEKDQ